MAYLPVAGGASQKKNMKTIKKASILPGQLCRQINISTVNYEVMDNLPSPMLSIEEKKPSLTSKDTCNAIVDQELSDLLRSRSRLTQTTSSSTSTVVSFEGHLHQRYSYFQSLSIIKPHYPMALERSHLEVIHFTWKDSFKPSKKHSHTSIGSEKVVVVFNIAAVYSQMAAAENKGTIDGLKKAYKAFYNAAGAFWYLREILGGGESIDVSTECVSMLEKLMVAQAQECFFNRAVRKGLLPTACSMAAREVELYYEKVLHALNTAPLKQHFDKGWFAHVQLKTSQFYAESCYHYSLHLHENDEIGEEIARLQMGVDRLLSMKKDVKGASYSLINVTSKLEKNINSQLAKAKRENDSIYRMRVPAAGTLKNLSAFASKWPGGLESLAELDICHII